MTRDLFADCPIPGGELGFLHLGGALNEHDEDDGAIGNRDARYMHGANGMWEPDEPNADAFQQWIRDAWTRLRPFSTGRTYINFQTADEGTTASARPTVSNFERLVEDQDRVRPRQSVPCQPEHPAGHDSRVRRSRSRGARGVASLVYEVAQSVAPGWERQRARIEESVTPVREWMIRELAPQPGDTLLELAAGAGDTGFEAAALVGEHGRLISTDFSPAMVEVARRRGAEVGLRTVDYRVVDAEKIELGSDSVDCVLCRFGYMLMAQPATALAETRRVLRPGGRLALAVWGAPERNPWITVLAGILVERGTCRPRIPRHRVRSVWPARSTSGSCSRQRALPPCTRRRFTCTSVFATSTTT